MALNINGYNTDFNAFAKFAQNSLVTNDKTAVARFEVGGAPLGGPPTPSPSSTSTATSSTWIICRASRSSPSRECPWGLTPWTLVQKKEAVQA